MPKQTFFNLPQEKQENLIQSATKEFSRVPLNKASISNIVKHAGIARGSFYQYFEDKEDAFYYLLEKQMKGHRIEFISALEENNGDVFAAFTRLFKHMLTVFQDKENRDFFKNAFLNMDYKMEKKIFQNFSKGEVDKKVSEITAAINVEYLNVADEREVIHVIQIMTAVTFQNLMHHFAKRYSFEEAIKNYKLEMNLLKKGLYKDHK